MTPGNKPLPAFVLPWAVFLPALFGYHIIFSHFFPTMAGEVGHDYMLTLPWMHDGLLWFRENGFGPVPWFTPSFCGGVPFFADPQSAYFSLPQWMILVLPPVPAIYLSLLVLAAISYWGAYLFTRHVLVCSTWCAVFAACFLMYNGFLSHRWIVGHTGFQGFALVPWIALLLCMARELPIGSLRWGGNALIAGLLIAYWPQSGMGSLIIPAALAVFALACLHVLVGGNLVNFLTRSLAAGVIAAGLSASKLSAAFAFMSHFPRSDYRLPGLDGIFGSLGVMLSAISLPGMTTFEVAGDVIRNTQWALNAHEWAYNVTPIPYAVMLVAGGWLLLKQRWDPGTEQKTAIVLLAVVLVIPVVLNIYTPGWNEILKSLPLIQSNSTLVRWFIVYLPLSCIAAAVLLDRLQLPGRRLAALVPVLLVTGWLLHAFEDRRYYFNAGAGYSAGPATAAWHSLREPNATPMIHRVDQRTRELFGNDLVYVGMSQAVCYNPVFGYRQEHLPLGPMVRGAAAFELPNNQLNLKNPACYVFPDENACAPGDHFSTGARDDFEAFRRYQPMAFAVSTRQMWANYLTLACLLACGVSVVVMLLQGTLRRLRSSGAG